MSALEPTSGLLGKEYAKETEAASDHHLHLRATGVRGGGEVSEGRSAVVGRSRQAIICSPLRSPSPASGSGHPATRPSL
jgi:hypothetical protein